MVLFVYNFKSGVNSCGGNFLREPFFADREKKQQLKNKKKLEPEKIECYTVDMKQRNCIISFSSPTELKGNAFFNKMTFALLCLVWLR